MEIERKFLIPDVYVKELFERDAERLEIEQYYVTVGTTEERYRRINGDCFFCGEKGHRFFPVASRNGDAVRRK